MPPTDTYLEEISSQLPALQLLINLGWQYLTPGEALALRDGKLKNVVLTGVLEPWLAEHNAIDFKGGRHAFSTANLREAVERLVNEPFQSLLVTNERIYELLTLGTSQPHTIAGDRRSYSLHYIDWQHPENNVYHVTDEFSVARRGSHKTRRPDIVLFVNGIPLVVIECKSPTIGEKWREEAIKQLRRYQEADDSFRGQGAPQLFQTVQLVVGTCGEQACYGTVGTPSRYFLDWKDPWPTSILDLERSLDRKPKAQDILLVGLLRPENLLDVVRNFFVFDAENGRTVKKVCRYRQFKAVNRALERIHAAKRPDERGGVVWHTQGSGKSLTMLWLALKLRRDPKLDNPGLVLVTDRTDLDRQLTRVFRQCSFAVDQAPSVKGLRTLLQNVPGHTVTTTIQKFQDATTPSGPENKRIQKEVHPTLNEAPNIFVMVDEAHRTQYAGLAANLRKAMPNACFLGFTGTPIDK
ncbi:MAG: type I restriction endonuclease subunit R, partial [Caldilinea sp.]|nr:type I restriction endonuclease subunit R [Caldilinea sp.]